MSSIRQNTEEIKSRIAAAAVRSGRKPDDVKLIAVTKLHEASEVDEAALAGITDVGENKVQELCLKQPMVKAALNWHLIGHLQTNKVKQIIGKVSLIHSVDSLHLAEEINKRAESSGIMQDILIQVNAAGEVQKSGICPQETEQLIRDISGSCCNINIKGLMFIAPAADDPEDVRVYFKEVKTLFDRLSVLSLDRVTMEILSMGMSGDYEVAIEEGSTMVRIGTAIFGQRDYSKKQ